MATTGKVPFRGFKAGLIGYVTRRGFAAAPDPVPGTRVRRPNYNRSGSRSGGYKGNAR